MQFFTAPLRNFFTPRYFDCRGRATRGEYWSVVFWAAAIFFGSFFLLEWLGMRSFMFPMYASFCIGMFLFIPFVSVTVRRLHDRNHSGLPAIWAFAIWMVAVHVEFSSISPCNGLEGFAVLGATITMAFLLPFAMVALLLPFTLGRSLPPAVPMMRQRRRGAMGIWMALNPWVRVAIICAVLTGALMLAAMPRALRFAGDNNHGALYWAFYLAMQLGDSTMEAVHPHLWFAPLLAGFIALACFTARPRIWSLTVLILAAAFFSYPVQSEIAYHFAPARFDLCMEADVMNGDGAQPPGAAHQGT